VTRVQFAVELNWVPIYGNDDPELDVLQEKQFVLSAAAVARLINLAEILAARDV
jgi:hypothetical protein